MLREIHRLRGRALFVGASLCVALSGCGTDEQSVGGPNKPEKRVEALSAGQITSVVTTINQAVAKQARVALERLEDDDLRAYAEQLIAEHREQEEELKTVVETLGVREEPSALKAELDEFSEKMNRSIEEETADQLAPTFIGVQIKMHKKGLSTVEQLLLHARPRELRTYLENYLAVQQKHLDRAMQLRKRFPEMESRR